MGRWCHKLLFLLMQMIFFTVFCERDIQCHDPDAGGTTLNKDRKFVVYSTQRDQNTGMGNLLIFFPAAYYFAAITGRDLLIEDNSIVGEMCKIISCGFPFVSEMAHAFPDLLGDMQVKHGETARAFDFKKYMEGTKNFSDGVILASGYKSSSDWYAYYNSSSQCVRKITGCELGDIGCSDRHAYQRLIRGPFKSALSKEEEGRIRGVPDHIKHAILSLPRAYAPRLDVAVHIRNSFQNFEIQTNISDIGYVKEVNDWLNSTECSDVFQSLKSKLIKVIQESVNTKNSTSEDDTVYVYLAADNQQVKESFEESIVNDENNSNYNFSLKVMTVDTKFVQHIKDLTKFKAVTDNEGLLDVVFDWYSLALSNTVIGWRKGYTEHVSTFVHSAQRVSGTTERTVIGAPIGHGIGTRGYQLMRHHNNNPAWESMWSYAVVDPTSS